MRKSQIIKKSISILLVVVLMLKTGGGLFLHNWLHTATPFAKTAEHAQGIEKNVRSCTCADDFYLPFSEPSKVIEPIIPAIKTTFIVDRPVSIFLTSRSFSSLRGPPTQIA